MRGSTVFEGRVGSPTGASRGWGVSSCAGCSSSSPGGSWWLRTCGPPRHRPRPCRAIIGSIARTGATDRPTSLRPCRPSTTGTTTSARRSVPPSSRRPPRTCAGRRARPSTWPGACRAASTTCASRCSTRGSSGSDAGDMADLATTAYMNLGEVQPPCWPGVATGDCDGTGLRHRRLRVAHRPQRQWAGRPRGPDPRSRGNDGVDDDRNGWVDDISGWDFLYGDNNPLDTVEYGHGTGEAKDSSAAEDGSGDVGVAPAAASSPSGSATRSSPTAAGSPPACCSHGLGRRRGPGGARR